MQFVIAIFLFFLSFGGLLLPSASSLSDLLGL